MFVGGDGVDPLPLGLLVGFDGGVLDGVCMCHHCGVSWGFLALLGVSFDVQYAPIFRVWRWLSVGFTCL